MGTWTWSEIPEPNLIGRPNVFRMMIPAVIENFAKTRGSGYYSPRFKLLKVAGSRGGNASWTLSASGTSNSFRTYRNRAVQEPKADFDLSMEGKPNGKKGERERRLLVRSPSGAVLKAFEWERRHQRDDGDDSFCCSNCRDRDEEERDSDDEDEHFGAPKLGSVSVKEATENGWLFDGALHVCVEILFELFEVKPASPTAPNATSKKLLKTLRSNVDDSPYSDFELISSDGHRIKTYKLLLASASPVFKAMFDTNCKETQEACCKIEDADGDTIKAFLGRVLGAPTVKFKEMDFQLLRKLSIFADKYRVLSLKKDCELQLLSRIDVDNVFDFLSYAAKYGSKPLKIAGFVFLEDNGDDPRADYVVEKMKQIGMELNSSLLEEYLDHVQLRQTGEPEGEAAVNGRKRKRGSTAKYDSDDNSEEESEDDDTDNDSKNDTENNSVHSDDSEKETDGGSEDSMNASENDSGDNSEESMEEDDM